MRFVFTVCVYGDFASSDVRLKFFPACSAEAFAFQNIMIDAGYNAELFSASDDEIPGLSSLIR